MLWIMTYKEILLKRGSLWRIIWWYQENVFLSENPNNAKDLKISKPFPQPKSKVHQVGYLLKGQS